MQVFNSDGDELLAFVSPVLGNNGFWTVDATNAEFSGTFDVKKIEVCLAGSGAISFVDYFDCGETNAPTTSPTTQSCPIIECDFSTLVAGVSLEDPEQAQQLLDDCLVTVSAIRTIANNPVNVFDSANIKGRRSKWDPDLGAPNEGCPGGGPGVGVGGGPDQPFQNCAPQGNLLIIQNEKEPISNPNDSASGGCLVFQFSQPMNLINLGIMDIDEPGLANFTVSTNRVEEPPCRQCPFVNAHSHTLLIVLKYRVRNQVTNSNDVELPTFDSPAGIGNNGFWMANSTLTISALTDIEKMVLCFPGSGALSFIHYSACDN
jgi:hypothetical protein